MPFQLLNGPLLANGVELYSDSVPCHGETASGDALFVETGRADGAVMILIVDVMGHGDEAAAAVAVLERQHLRTPTCQGLRPGELLSVLHHLLQPLWDDERVFVSAQALLIDARSNLLAGANAAIPEPWVFVGVSLAWRVWPLPNGTLLGLPISSPLFAEAITALKPDDLLLGFTDGVSEAGQAMTAQFQHGHLQQFLAGVSGGTSPRSVVDLLMNALSIHVGADWPEDDTTAVALQLR